MGYTTTFRGRFDLDRPLTVEQLAEWMAFVDDDERREGASCGGGLTAPTNYCDWVPSSDGAHIEWNGGEKFYRYVEWLKFLIAKFVQPWGLTLSGRVEWSGEDPEDQGVIHVRGNEVQAIENRITKPDPAWQIEKPEPKWGAP